MSRWHDRANRNTFWCSVFVDQLHRAGVDCVCVSPGSRSTPLVLALANHPGFRLISILDERSAGFFALGMAKTTGRPVALVCTSGTAAVNLHPAVVEADLSGVPLILLTADRPPLLRDTGAGQTIDQLKLYGDSVRWFHEVGEPVMRSEDLRRLRGLAARAVFEATRPPAGPVHLNFPFRKPLEAQPVPGDVPDELEGAPHEGEAPQSRAHRPLVSAPPGVLEALARRVRENPRGLILCGPMNHPPHPSHDSHDSPVAAPGGVAGNGEQNREEFPAVDFPAVDFPAALALLARKTGYPVLAEPPSGAFGGEGEDAPRILARGEAMLQCREFRDRLRPQLILRFGAMPTSKHVEVLLEEHPGCPVVLVNEGGSWLEPGHHPTELISAEPAGFCNALAQLLTDPMLTDPMLTDPMIKAGQPGETHPGTGWLEAFQEADRVAGQAIEEAFQAPPPRGVGGEWFEGRVFSELAQLLPAGAVQYTASSMPVRDLAAFTPGSDAGSGLQPVQPVRHLVNRGANGIDGTLSSALGAAAARAGSGKPTVLVTGDVALIHDSNALRIAKQYQLPLTVVLINNDGGGIFEMLPISEYGEDHERFFGTPHGIDFASLCSAYGIPHQLPGDWDSFGTALRTALEGQTPGGEGAGVIEIRTDRRHNRVQHERIWQIVSERLQETFPPDRTIP